MKAIASTTLAMIGVLVIASATLAWHVTTDPGTLRQGIRVTAEDFGPKGDPLYRIVVSARRTALLWSTCRGTVSVPDEPWAQGTTFTVDGKAIAIGPGETAKLRPGDYVGRWSNSDEVEHFTIPPCTVIKATGPVAFTWRYVQNGSVVRLQRSVPLGCTYRTGWKWLDPNTSYRVTSRGEVILYGRAAPLGNYGTPPAVDTGVSC